MISRILFLSHKYLLNFWSSAACCRGLLCSLWSSSPMSNQAPFPENPSPEAYLIFVICFTQAHVKRTTFITAVGAVRAVSLLCALCTLWVACTMHYALFSEVCMQCSLWSSSPRSNQAPFLESPTLLKFTFVWQSFPFWERIEWGRFSQTLKHLRCSTSRLLRKASQGCRWPRGPQILWYSRLESGRCWLGLRDVSPNSSDSCNLH